MTALSDGTSFSYDSNGNRTQKTKGSDIWVYTYGHANRLMKVEKNDVALGEYVYDGEGNRVQATEDGVTVTYIYASLLVLYEKTTTGIATYIHGPTGMLAKRTTIDEETNMFYYHTDLLGSTRLVTDDNKNIVTAAAYHPFGESSTEEGSESFLFTGKEKDSTGLYYYGARYYDPEIGGFISRDPLTGGFSSTQNLNRYTYCMNNPASRVDPTGMVSFYNAKTGVRLRITSEGWSLIFPDGSKITRADLDAIDEEIEEAKEIKDMYERKKALKAALSHLLEVWGVEHTWDPEYGKSGKLEIKGFLVNIETMPGMAGEVVADTVEGVLVAGYLNLDWSAFDDGAACLAIIMAHELKHVEQQLTDPTYYSANEDIAEAQADAAADAMHKNLIKLYPLKNPLNWWKRILMRLAKARAKDT